MLSAFFKILPFSVENRYSLMRPVRAGSFWTGVVYESGEINESFLIPVSFFCAGPARPSGR